MTVLDSCHGDIETCSSFKLVSYTKCGVHCTTTLAERVLLDYLFPGLCIICVSTLQYILPLSLSSILFVQYLIDTHRSEQLRDIGPKRISLQITCLPVVECKKQGVKLTPCLTTSQESVFKYTPAVATEVVSLGSIMTSSWGSDKDLSKYVSIKWPL